MQFIIIVTNEHKKVSGLQVLAYKYGSFDKTETLVLENRPWKFCVYFERSCLYLEKL